MADGRPPSRFAADTASALRPDLIHARSSVATRQTSMPSSPAPAWSGRPTAPRRANARLPKAAGVLALGGLTKGRAPHSRLVRARPRGERHLPSPTLAAHRHAIDTASEIERASAGLSGTDGDGP